MHKAAGVNLDNLNNLSRVVLLYKRKLRRPQARALIAEMENEIEAVVGLNIDAPIVLPLVIQVEGEE